MRMNNRDFQIECANRIANYWARLGAKVNVQVERDPNLSASAHNAPAFTVTSDMVNGLPPQASPALISRILQQEKSK